MPYASKEKRIQYHREYKRKYREKIVSRRKELYRLKNPLIANKNWYDGRKESGYCKSCILNTYKKPNKNCKEERHLKYFKYKREKNNQFRRKVRQTDPNKYREDPVKRNKRQRGVHKKSRKELIERLGGKCKVCGFNDFRALEIDHTNGGGNKERVKHGWQYKNKLIKMDVNTLNKEYQCLCSNCHSIKTYEEICKK